jgi:hypothetical protein
MVQKRWTSEKAPVPNASRVYRFVDAAAEDALAVAMAYMVDRGWTPIEKDARIIPAGAFVEVVLWAVPPGKATS